MWNPMYRQIADDLREQIESGQLEPGQQLRTELELREVIQRFAKHRPRRHQVAHHPRTGRDAPRAGDLRC